LSGLGQFVGAVIARDHVRAPGPERMATRQPGTAEAENRDGPARE
jgi:hypothetical protein